ncbi:MAG TPA: hypothetical protein VML96_09370, partial [Egibacteraceae bacterium]|nr:hypothetical protein [Egibacteraceae bacterium]
MRASPARSLLGSGDWRLHTPDEVLLRRFGLVRVMGAAAYTIGALAMLGLVGAHTWPLAIGVPVLAGATLAYVRWSDAAPRAAVAASLAVDAAVLAGAIAFIGGAGSGLVMLFSIAVVSAGILLGRSAALAFTVATTVLALGQLMAEEVWDVRPILLAPPVAGERRMILMLSLAGLLSVGYLSATYASRLHDLIAVAGAEADRSRGLGRRRRAFVEQTVLDARVPLEGIEDIADALDDPAAQLPAGERPRRAARLRVLAAQLDTKIETLGQAGAL